MRNRAASILTLGATLSCSFNATPEAPIPADAQAGDVCELGTAYIGETVDHHRATQQLLAVLDLSCGRRADVAAAVAAVRYVQLMDAGPARQDTASIIAEGRAAIADRCGGTLPQHQGPPAASCSVPNWLISRGGWSHSLVAAAMLYDVTRQGARDDWARNYADWVLAPMGPGPVWHAASMPLPPDARAPRASTAVRLSEGPQWFVDARNITAPIRLDPPAIQSIDDYLAMLRDLGQVDSVLYHNVSASTPLGTLVLPEADFRDVHYLVAYKPEGTELDLSLTPESLVGALPGPVKGIRELTRFLDPNEVHQARILRLTPTTLTLGPLTGEPIATYDLSNPSFGVGLRTALCDKSPVLGVLASGDVTVGRLTRLWDEIIRLRTVGRDESCVQFNAPWMVEVVDGPPP